MSIPGDAAEMVARVNRLRRPITEQTMDRVLLRLGLKVLTIPRDLPVREFRRGKLIGIREDQPCDWRIWLKAHGLGHYLLHRGEQLTIKNQIIVARQERQAELFAGCLLLGEDYRFMESWEIAERCGLPPECVSRWLKLVKGERLSQ